LTYDIDFLPPMKSATKYGKAELHLLIVVLGLPSIPLIGGKRTTGGGGADNSGFVKNIWSS